ncbi:MAG: M14 metallopeptidase family protein [Acidobacteriota bacterium]
MKKSLAARQCRKYVSLVLLLFGFLCLSMQARASIPSPEDFFGFKMGTARHIARWDNIVEYFYVLEKNSDKLKVVDMGPSTMGHPFLVVFISSADNLNRMNELQSINARLSDPRGVPEEEIQTLIQKGTAVICQSMSLHATEIGGTQMAVELTHDLLTGEDDETLRILDNVMFVMIPSFNPDGQIMVTDWYRKTVGTEYEGSNLPWLYHKYVGHDNNRDGDFLNMIESVYAAKIMFRDWIPQAYIDHHHMGSYGARFYIPPYCDPIRPYADPLVWREHSWYGAHIAYKLEEEGKQGILNAAQFPGWGHFGWHWITPFHNIAGMLTESASAKLATPLYIHPEQLQAGARQFPRYEAQSTFPNPWEGGWWTLREIVEQKKISALALLDLAARNRETVLRNAYLKAKRQTERGAAGDVKAYIVPAVQHDPLTAVKMINTLLLSGIEIHQAVGPLTVDGRMYAAGSAVISLAQPKMGLIRNLMGRTFYPDNEWTRAQDGTPLRPYDLATHTMAEFMGVRVDPVVAPVQGDLKIITDRIAIEGRVDPVGPVYIVDGRQNAAFRAVNLLTKAGIDVFRADSGGEGFLAGDFLVESKEMDVIKKVAAQTGVDFKSFPAFPEKGHTVKPPRIGMYQRYYGGNMDEGWTRFVLEQFNFPFASLLDEEINKGGLNKKYDVIVFPHDSTNMIMGNPSGRYGRSSESVPPEYRSGLGTESLNAIKEFVRSGGTIVTLGGACAFAIDKFDLDVRSVLDNLTSKEFFCPGSTLRAEFDNTHPLAFGMPDDGCVVFYSGMAFEVTPGQNSEFYETVVRYKKKDILQSGWLDGEEFLSGKAAMIRTQFGKGRIVLIGFRPQNRSQTHGTYKLLFNAVMR